MFLVLFSLVFSFFDGFSWFLTLLVFFRFGEFSAFLGFGWVFQRCQGFVGFFVACFGPRCERPFFESGAISQKKVAQRKKKHTSFIFLGGRQGRGGRKSQTDFYRIFLQTCSGRKRDGSWRIQVFEEQHIVMEEQCTRDHKTETLVAASHYMRRVGRHGGVKMGGGEKNKED